MKKHLLFFLLSTAVFLQKNTAQAQNQLFGLASKGGSGNLGSIFHYIPATDTLIADNSFTSPYVGKEPYYTQLCLGSNGKFYGLSSKGGASDSGVLFEWDPSTGSYTAKVEFGASKGRLPLGTLVQVNGNFYGTCTVGGDSGYGTLFEWNPANNKLTVKHAFGTSGFAPNGTLTVLNNKLYGTTSGQGLGNKGGVIFEFDPTSNAYTEKYNFGSSNLTGQEPMGAMVVYNGSLYGMTNEGGNGLGVIYQYNPTSNTCTNRHSFDGSAGGEPEGALVVYNNSLYGMGYSGGVNGMGTIFEWNPLTGIITKKVDFDDTNGAYPTGSLCLLNGKFYGMTPDGGAQAKGVFFEWDPSNNTFIKRLDFTGLNGDSPVGTPAVKGSSVYALTTKGGASNAGSIFEWNPAGSIYTKKLDLSGNKGILPQGSLIRINKKLYGLTSEGGESNGGVLFEWDPKARTYTVKVNFNAATGTAPLSELCEMNGRYFGTCSKGGANRIGTIFEWNPESGAFTKKVDFTGPMGAFPKGKLCAFNGKLYGFAYGGGGKDALGTLYVYDPTSNSLNKIKELNFDSGVNPEGGLVVFNNKLYGTIKAGGKNNAGTLIEYDPATGIFAKKADFNSATGAAPSGTMIAYKDGLFGLCFEGSPTKYGSVFFWSPESQLQSVANLEQSTGHALGSFVFSDGKLYALSNDGGSQKAGAVISFNPANNTVGLEADLLNTIGNKPIFTQLVALPCELDNSVFQNGTNLYANQENGKYQWINCSGNVPVAGATEQSFKPTKSGKYAVIIRKDGCIDTSSCSTVTVFSSVEENEANALAISPNPTSGKVRLDLPERMNGTLSVYDIQGKRLQEMLVRQEQIIDFSLEGYPKGIYVIKLEDGKGAYRSARVHKE